MRTSTARSLGLVLGVLSATVAGWCGTGLGAASAASAVRVVFVPHGRFSSRETHQPVAIDPQVFAALPGARAGGGPQGIWHAAGFAPVRLSAPGQTPLYTALGHPLGFTLGQWLAARGDALIAPQAGGDRVAAAVAGLIPEGVCSLFTVTFAPGGNTFAPLDRTGTTNTFTADVRGAATIAVTALRRLTAANAVLLVYHSGRRAHGMERGVPGVTAHHQLIARVP
jgi:hypothetical protein